MEEIDPIQLHKDNTNLKLTIDEITKGLNLAQEERETVFNDLVQLRDSYNALVFEHKVLKVKYKAVKNINKIYNG